MITLCDKLQAYSRADSRFALAGVTVSAFPRAGNAPLVTAHARY